MRCDQPSGNRFENRRAGRKKMRGVDFHEPAYVMARRRQQCPDALKLQLLEAGKVNREVKDMKGNAIRRISLLFNGKRQ
jgi:hypothetical protein